MADSLIETILEKDYSSLKDGIETVVATKLFNRVQSAKTEILAGLNGVSVEKQAEMLAVKTK